ncbi:hypothetical protein [Methanobacterium spitsbergense]|uniref:Uncharacterized protein n=1 Tax=Methanobacterium spitsbergense TaxID=2874285 RepID=A0A8T5UXK3_9EURY|nr:hypothetical protein [Methanobacterium spitsbergense]MBZ2165900.1 hypothetical protein [Methanobacterium spitsbergense]
MAGKIFLLQEGNELVEMEEKEYVSEDILQDLVAKYPNLLAGDEMNVDIPRRWLLVQRELDIYSVDEMGSEKLSIDHLFLDQDAIPTIVETKRSSDGRLRREVVGQMMDYASNLLVYIPVEKIISSLTFTYPTMDQNELLKEELGLEISPDEFWEQVKTNLQAGKIRLVFVADIIPTKLRTIVEFLNIQMDPTEVYAVELKQYVGEGLKTLIPRLVGKTAEYQAMKPTQSEILNETTFFEQLDEKTAVFYRKLLDYAKEKQLLVLWTPKGFSLNIVKDENNINIIRGYSNLSAYGQALFVTVDSIRNKISNGESIVEEYKDLKDFATEINDGYWFDITKMNDEQTNRFFEVVTHIIKRINKS